MKLKTTTISVLLFGAFLGVSQCRKAEPPATPGAEKKGAPEAPGTTAKPKPTARPLIPEVGQAAKGLETDRSKLLFVSDLKPSKVTFEYVAPRMDTQWEGSPLELGTQTFDKGVGMHSPSAVSFTVPPKATAFQAKIGLGPGAAECPTKAGFMVKDETGKLLFSLPEVHPHDGSLDISIPVVGVKEITLVAGDGGDGRDCDHENWVLAAFVFPDAASRPAVKESKPAAAK